MHGSDKEDFVASMMRLRRLPVELVRRGYGSTFDADRMHEIVDGYLGVLR